MVNLVEEYKDVCYTLWHYNELHKELVVENPSQLRKKSLENIDRNLERFTRVKEAIETIAAYKDIELKSS